MKIAFINIYQGAVERGAEVFVGEVSKRLSKNHKVSVLSFFVKPKRRYPVLWRFYLDPFGLQTFWCSLKLLPGILKEKYDIVVPVNGGWQPALMRLATWFYGGKMIVSGQSGIGWDDRNNLWCFPDCFVALTDHAKKWARKVNPFVKVKAISNGVNIKKFASEKEKLDFGLEKPVVLCVGALNESKRHNLAIYAVSKLEAGSLLLVGKGEAKNDLYNLGEKHLKGRFKIISFDHNKMPKVYSSADVFTFPTNPNESFGIVLLEAMASGLPVVTSDDPIRREIVGSGGIFVDPTDTEEYAKALKYATGVKRGKELLERAKNYDWGRIAERYEELFMDLVG